jgi:hypothetical protein
MKSTPELNLGPVQKKIFSVPDPEGHNNQFN